jgi:hypothetical protein
MGVFLPEPSDDWKAQHVYVTKETTHRTFRRVYGAFKLSDGTMTRWTYKRGCYWYDHNDKRPENVAITRNRIKQIVEEMSAPSQFKGRPEEVVLEPPVLEVPDHFVEVNNMVDEDMPSDEQEEEDELEDADSDA